VPWAEVRARPAIEPAGFGVLHRQDRNADSERDQEENRREEPQENRTRAGMRGRCDPARADDAGDGKERQIAEPEFALECQLMSSVMRSASFGTTMGRLPKFGWMEQSPGPFSWPV
jgi:hypothetical protein